MSACCTTTRSTSRTSLRLHTTSIDDAEREALGARSPYNVVHIDLPAEADGRDRYENACFLLHHWLEEGVLRFDEEPSFYVYRMGYHDEDGHALQTAGVIGALELSEPGTKGVFPHEQTTPKAHSDRLDMLRSCRANLSAVWGLSLTSGLGALCRATRASRGAVDRRRRRAPSPVPGE